MLVSANGLGDDVLSVGNAGSNPVTSTNLHRQMIALSAFNCTSEELHDRRRGTGGTYTVDRSYCVHSLQRKQV